MLQVSHVQTAVNIRPLYCSTPHELPFALTEHFQAHVLGAERKGEAVTLGSELYNNGFMILGGCSGLSLIFTGKTSKPVPFSTPC